MTNPVWQETRLCEENRVLIEILILQKHKRDKLPGRMTTANRLIGAARAAERYLDTRGLPDDLRIGTRWKCSRRVVRPDLPPSAMVLGADVQLIRKADGWYVLTIAPKMLPNGTPGWHVVPTYTCAAEDWLADRLSAVCRDKALRYRQGLREAA